MGLFSFRNTQKPRRFNHIPIYWNEEKEKREEREVSAEKAALSKKNKTYTPSIKRGSFRKYSERLDVEKKTSATRKSTIKLMIALFLLFILGLFIFINSNAIYALYFDSTF